MANFKKSDMLFEKEYTWKRDTGDGNYIGRIDKDRLDRDEGYEVLYFANEYLSKEVFFPDKNDLQKLEMLLRNNLPSRVVMKDEVWDFLKKNW